MPNRFQGVTGLAAWANAPSCPDCVSFEDARVRLGVRRLATVNHRAYAGLLDKCLVDGTDAGVTAASIDAEITWWREARFTQKMLRRLRETLSYL